MRFMVLCIFLLTFLNSCNFKQVIEDRYTSLKQNVKGQYYLDRRKYKEGIKVFEPEAKANPESAETQYFMGRFYLAEGQKKKALSHLERAAMIVPDNADYHFWLGVAYAVNKKSVSERTCYLKALEIDNKYVQALTYLGHNQFEKAEYEDALKTYDKAIALWPENASALYSRALILKRLERTPEERLAWKQYLSVYQYGAMARQAVYNLNAIGDFEYRNHLIGRRMVPLKKIEFEPSTDVIMKTSKPSLEVLAELLKNNESIAIHIVAYQENNKRLAEDRAKSVKKYLVKTFTETEPSRLNVSWFGKSEEIKIGKETFQEEAFLKFITTRRENKHIKSSSKTVRTSNLATFGHRVKAALGRDEASVERSAVEVEKEQASLRSAGQVARAEKRAAAAAEKTDLNAKATIEFLEMAEKGLEDAKNSGKWEAIETAQAACDVAAKSAEETVAEALGVPEETVRAMRNEGLKWGQIANELGAQPKMLGLVYNKRGRVYPKELSLGSGKYLQLKTEIEIATRRNTKSGLNLGHGVSAADGFGLGGFILGFSARRPRGGPGPSDDHGAQ